MRYNVYSKRVSVLFPRLYRPDDCATGQQRAQSMCLLSELTDGGGVCRGPVVAGARVSVSCVTHLIRSTVRSRSFASLAPPSNEFLQYL